MLGKHSKKHFHDSNSKACKKLELVQSDLYGLLFIPSANGNKYLINFIDNYTRTYRVYLLKQKYEAF